MSWIRAVLSTFAAALVLATPLSATWSIVIVDVATGEVAVAIATCLANFDLRPSTVVVVPGRGVAAAQSFVGPLALRQLVRDGLLQGDTATQILAQLAAADASHQSRQYGIVSLIGGEVSFTGSGAFAWAGGLTGQSGTLRYAIQGNVLTGAPVVAACEQAIQTTAGGLPDKLMAAMEAARSFGGDGRCSCSQGAPTSCGSPPASFTKSAHCALMIVSRPSDLDEACSGSFGCGAGDYWLDLNVANQPASAPDPVQQLRGLFNAWKAQQVGRPDHFTSTVTTSAATLRADGASTIDCTVVLRDAAGQPLGNSLPVAVGLAAESTVANVAFGPVVPQANGSYTFTMRGDFDAGDAVLDVAVTDAVGHVGLWPRPTVQLTDVFGACGAGAIPDGGGGAADALRILGRPAVDRVVEVGFGRPFTITLDAPFGAPGASPVGLFALWLHAGLPPVGAQLPLGSAGGSLCFTPQPFAPAAPTLLLADSFGLGGIGAPAAPWSLPLPGLPALLDLALQAVIFVDAQATLAASNAVYLRIVPLPAPVITSIVPPAPTTGQQVVVRGAEFDAGMVATVGGVVVPLTVLGPNQAQFVMPPSVGCDSVLALGNPGGLASTAPINATPVITSTPITSGPAGGGGTFLILGQNLLGASVTVAGAPIVPTTQTATLLLLSMPAGAPGQASVIVRNAVGCQAATVYTYL